jgi:outer membrane receptor protein involved in Fe transport
VLPSGTLVYSFNDRVQLRGSVTRTIARPQLRELAPFAFADYFGGWVVTGEPDLKLTRILNADLRLDWFPTTREVFSFSAFIKDFTDPIEPVFLPSGASTPVLTYANALGAFLYGFELEGRQGLGAIASWLKWFTIIGNLTIAQSTIQVRQTGMDESGMVRTLTNTSRAMVNQAPYVVNLMLDFDGEHGTQVRLLYNVSGKQIVTVGTEGLDDAYLHPRNMLDLTISQTLWNGLKVRASVQNMINPEYLVTHGKKYRADRVLTRYREGISASLSLGYTY